jgi:hypothetical protein
VELANVRVKGQLLDQFGQPLITNGQRHDIRALVDQSEGRTARHIFCAIRWRCWDSWSNASRRWG